MTIPILRAGEAWTRLVVAISGASGLIGSALAAKLEQDGHEVRRLVRRPARTPLEITWDPDAGTIHTSRLAGIDALVHLAGENLAQRWSEDVKRRIRESRTRSTTLLATTIAALPAPPKVMISGSAIGIYGSRDDESLDEDSTLGNDFLAGICKEWEASARPAADAGIRLVNIRTGIVLSTNGGALPKMLIPFRFGVGGTLGNGKQWMSWIGLADTVAAIAFLLTSSATSGPVNLVAPNPVRNEEFTRTLGAVLHRPALFSVPRFAMHLAMGEMADETALASQRVRPRRLLAASYQFLHPALETALRAVLGER